MCRRVAIPTWSTGRRHARDTNVISYAPNARAVTRQGRSPPTPRTCEVAFVALALRTPRGGSCSWSPHRVEGKNGSGEVHGLHHGAFRNGPNRGRNVGQALVVRPSFSRCSPICALSEYHMTLPALSARGDTATESDASSGGREGWWHRSSPRPRVHSTECLRTDSVVCQDFASRFGVLPIGERHVHYIAQFVQVGRQ